MSLDRSIIDLSVSLFDRAKYRRTKGAIKLHVLLNHDGCLPSFEVVTAGKTSEINSSYALASTLADEGEAPDIPAGYGDRTLPREGFGAAARHNETEFSFQRISWSESKGSPRSGNRSFPGIRGR
jgi:hypothetical protein